MKPPELSKSWRPNIKGVSFAKDPAPASRIPWKRRLALEDEEVTPDGILWAQSERSSPLRHRNHRSSHGPAPFAKQGLRAAVFHSASKLMQEILHLNLHREFSLLSQESRSASNIENGRLIGASGWKIENTMRSFFATVM
jgi:hypothetical protein